MAEERDPKVSQRYRELGREEPPSALDDAILAASRRAIAPRRGWYVPLAAAAAAVMAVGVALHVQREQPDPEAMTAPSEAKEAPRDVSPPISGPAEHAPAPEAKPAPRLKREQQDAASESMQRAPASPTQERRSAPAAAPPIPQTAPAPRFESAPAPKRAPAPSAIGDLQSARVYEDPEQWLGRIADLRRQGRHDEADQAFAEFQRQYPDYRIPEQMLGKIQKK